MSMGHQLQTLKDEELLAALSTIVRKSNEITAELIAHLAELDQRQLHLDLGFPSLFACCVQSLGLCEATAGRRIAVARVCRRYPQALTRVASGALHVSALCPLKQYLTTENANDLFELCSGKSARQVEVLLATRFPMGGHDSTANLRLRCRAHNQRYAQQCFGPAPIRAARAAHHSKI